LERGTYGVENQYVRAVRASGNLPAQQIIAEVFEAAPRKWRGLGNLAESGFALRASYAAYDAEKRFAIGDLTADEPLDCISGLILQGLKKPTECPNFSTRCTPDTPMGATMVSSEGACAAYYRYRSGARVTE